MGKKVWLPSVFFFLGFAVFTLLVHLGIFNSLDFDITVKLQNVTPAMFTLPFSLLSLLGSLEIATLILLPILLITPKINKFFVLFSYGLMMAIETFGKYVVYHKGPPFMFFRYDIPFYFPSTHVQPGFSYPSGHMARTAFISAMLFILIWNSKLRKEAKYMVVIILFLFDLVMMASRIYLGEHWTTDVVGGALLGASLGVLATIWPQKLTLKG